MSARQAQDSHGEQLLAGDVVQMTRERPELAPMSEDDTLHGTVAIGADGSPQIAVPGLQPLRMATLTATGWEVVLMQRPDGPVTIHLPACGIGEHILVHAPTTLHDRLYALVPRLTFGPSYDREVLRLIRLMSDRFSDGDHEGALADLVRAESLP